MKVYIASNPERTEEVKEYYKILRENGFDISFDWTNLLPIEPYDQNLRLANQYTTHEVYGVRFSDIFVLLNNEKERENN